MHSLLKKTLIFVCQKLIRYLDFNLNKKQGQCAYNYDTYIYIKLKLN